MTRLTALAAAAVLALGAFGLPASAARADNTAVAINTKDGSSLFKLAFAIRRAAGDVVDESNAAVAFASCTDCQTVAVAIEIVLVMGNPSIVDPTNLALAYNYECDLCVTFADAMQFVFSTGGPVHFTADGNKELAQIRQELEQLRQENLPLDQLLPKLDAIRKELITILTTQLVPAGNSGSAQKGQDQSSTQPSSTAPTQTQPAQTQPPTTGSSTTTPATTGTTTEPTTTGTTTTGP